jgi:hypothetical protein
MIVLTGVANRNQIALWVSLGIIVKNIEFGHLLIWWKFRKTTEFFSDWPQVGHPWFLCFLMLIWMEGVLITRPLSWLHEFYKISGIQKKWAKNPFRIIKKILLDKIKKLMRLLTRLRVIFHFQHNLIIFIKKPKKWDNKL